MTVSTKEMMSGVGVLTSAAKYAHGIYQGAYSA